MPIIIALVIAIFLILISWTWHNLGSIDKNKKIAIIIATLVILFIITLIVFNISTKDLPYKDNGEIEPVRNVLVVLFTFLNGLVIMPTISKTISQIYEKEIDSSKAIKRVVIAVVIFIIVLIIECGYLKDIQKGILGIYQNKLNK